MTTKTAFPRILVRNLQRATRINAVDLEKFVSRAVQACLKLRKPERTELKMLCDVFVLLISDRKMSELHRRFLNQCGPTDVLTFDHGEIFISVETAKRNARAFGSSLGEELRLYIIHGLLHLHGFDDSSDTSARIMARTQQKILRQIA